MGRLRGARAQEGIDRFVIILQNLYGTDLL